MGQSSLAPKDILRVPPKASQLQGPTSSSPTSLAALLPAPSHTFKGPHPRHIRPLAAPESDLALPRPPPPQQPEETSRRREACRPRPGQAHWQTPLSAARAQATRRRRAQGPVPSPVRSLALRLPKSKPEHLSLGLGPGWRPRPLRRQESEELKHRERAEQSLVTLPATEHLTSLPTFGALFNSRINSLRRRRKEPTGTRRCPESCPAGVARGLLGFVVRATVALFTSVSL